MSSWLILKQQWTIKISSPLFSIFSLAAILVGSRDHRTKFWKGPSKDHSTKVWLQLAQWFLRRLKCEMLTDGRQTKSDDNSSHGLKARWAKKFRLKQYVSLRSKGRHNYDIYKCSGSKFSLSHNGCMIRVPNWYVTNVQKHFECSL